MALSKVQKEEQEQEGQDLKWKSKTGKEEQEQEEAYAGVACILNAQEQALQLFEGRAIWALEADQFTKPCLKH